MASILQIQVSSDMIVHIPVYLSHTGRWLSFLTLVVTPCFYFVNHLVIGLSAKPLLIFDHCRSCHIFRKKEY